MDPHAANAAFQPLPDDDLRQQVQKLRALDNVTNLYYLVQVYLFLGLVIGLAIAFCQYAALRGWSEWWNVPVVATAVVLIGAGQHRLSALGHEAAHHLLLANRYWNDVISNWCCMFPLFSGTHAYRLQHLAHHQFVNDPARDPDVAQMRSIGFWEHFPLSGQEVWRTLLAQLWPPNLLRYVLARARYGASGAFEHPYTRQGIPAAKRPMRVCLACLALQVALLTGLVLVADWRLLAAAPLALWVVSLWIVSRIPEGMYDQWRLRPTISDRATLLMIASYYTLLVVALAWITLLTGVWAAVYFFLLWVLPLLTSFPFFMLLRQFVQHANCDRGKFTNTRVFLIGWLFEFAIFPFGQKYHLPHHLFASVPHYRLKELHEILLGDSDYRDAAVIVHGYVLHKPGHPTVIDVLGDPPAAGGPGDPYLDDDVLSGNVVV